MSDSGTSENEAKGHEGEGRSGSDGFKDSDIDVFLKGNGFTTFSAAIARQWLQRVLNDDAEAFSRVRAWMWNEIQDMKPSEIGSKWQRCCPEYIPGLRSQAFWDTEEFPWAAEFEANWKNIRDEVIQLKGKQGFQQYRAPTWADGVEASPGEVTPSTDTSTEPAANPASTSTTQRVGKLGTDEGNWSVAYLDLHNVDCSKVRELCPLTVKLLSSIDGFYHHAFFSSMSRASHITAHTGPTNKKLRCQLPLIVPRSPDSACRLRAGEEVATLREGKCLVFDDSYEHEAWNDAEAPRLILIFDIWHPDLSMEERKFLTFLQNAKLRHAERLSAAGVVPPHADFYEVIKRSREVAVDDEMVFPTEEEQGPGEDRGVAKELK